MYKWIRGRYACSATWWENWWIPNCRVWPSKHGFWTGKLDASGRYRQRGWRIPLQPGQLACPRWREFPVQVAQATLWVECEDGYREGQWMHQQEQGRWSHTKLRRLGGVRRIQGMECGEIVESAAKFWKRADRVLGRKQWLGQRATELARTQGGGLDRIGE